jgi:hypothetical protein
MQTTYDIFVSYPHKHRDWVRSFVEALEKHNLKVWFDEKAILPGESFVEKLEEGIRNSNAVVYIVTPEAVHSKWALIELGAALGGKDTYPDCLRRRARWRARHPDSPATLDNKKRPAGQRQRSRASFFTKRGRF